MGLFSRFFRKETLKSEPASTETSSGYDKLIEEVPFAGDLEASDADDAAAKDTEAVAKHTAESSERESSPEVRAFRDFLATDLRIKRELIQLAPSEQQLASEEGCVDYVDNAFKAFRDLRSDFARLENAFSNPTSRELLPNTKRFFSSGESAFALKRYDAASVKRLYNDKFAQMRPEFIERVKEECCGYAIFASPETLYNEAVSVNELLHAHHAAALNNERIMASIPEMASKKTLNGYGQVFLRGEDTPFGRDIFEAFPEDFDAGNTDIVAIGNQVMMMVRDRGHALTLDIDVDPNHPDEAWVQYHVPKICNRAMVEALPGVGEITEAGADGRFAVKRDSLGAQIVDFVGRVPTDMDMSKPGGLYYRPSSEENSSQYHEREVW